MSDAAVPDERIDRSADGRGSRIGVVDTLRGLAIAGVVVFHVVWDLDFTGMIMPGIAGHWIWILFGRILAGTFMFLVGISLVLGHSDQVRWRPFLRRTLIVAAAALLISIVTWFVFPLSFAYFGILHAIVIASFVGIPFLRFPPALTTGCAVLLLLLPVAITFSELNSRWLAWIGLSERPPSSIDFVPVMPWVGLTLLGIAVARIAQSISLDEWLRARQSKSRGFRVIRSLGRHSLLIYLLHQPILFGALTLIAEGI